ncbi:hypothetical protein MFLAVUS_009721 [Mucor flavus]|uniref:Uncharacterized protein n=1 Tax=Mucor flavus TaxID=439312 RepID=A0ABP9ZAQ3_9FUNG
MAADNSDSLLFWIEQEPTDTTEDMYLPPDTPPGQLSHKVRSQANKNQELKKQRAIERLKAVHLENLRNFRKTFASLIARDQLPNQHAEYLEFVSSDTSLKDNLSDILKLVEDIDTIQQNASATADVVKSLQVKETTSKEMRQELYLKEQVRVKYAQVLEVRVDEQFNNQQHQITSQYYKLLYLIKPSIARPTIPTESEPPQPSPSLPYEQ